MDFYFNKQFCYQSLFFYLVSYIFYTFFHIFRIHSHLFRFQFKISHSHFSILYIYFSYFVYLFLLFHIFTFPIKKYYIFFKLIFSGSSLYSLGIYTFQIYIMYQSSSLFAPYFQIFLFSILDDFFLLFNLKPFSVCFSFWHVAKAAYFPTYLPFIFKHFFLSLFFFIHILSIYSITLLVYFFIYSSISNTPSICQIR